MFYMLLLITVFTLISFTLSNAVVVQSIRILFPFSSFSSSTSWYHLLTFFLNAASSFTVNLAVPVTILVLSYLSFSMFRLTSFLFKSSLIMCSFLLILLFVYTCCYCFLLLLYFIRWLLLLPSSLVCFFLSFFLLSFLTDCLFLFFLSLPRNFPHLLNCLASLVVSSCFFQLTISFFPSA